MSFHDRFQAMKAANDFSALQDAVPYAKFLGISADVRDGRVITTMAYADRLIGNTALPALHGGTIAALLEMAAIFQTAYEAETEIMPKTITITIDYMRSGAARDTHARAWATRIGRRVANVRVEAWQDDPAKPIAAANVNFLLT
ncbi:PaaI family thioesterase [Iodidimonas sp. SYSU 1G8]|uniref:PaaI family thioesterase n=1 Tax=Iodidimonas sp. SYSU 1G8 TaxID=3133967 RepID=UPI0031FEEEC8